MDVFEKIYPATVDEVFNTLIDICRGSRFRIDRIEKNTRRIFLSTEMSLFSYGEKLNIIVSQHKDGVIVHVESSAKIGFNITASGKVAENLRFIINELDENFG